MGGPGKGPRGCALARYYSHETDESKTHMVNVDKCSICGDEAKYIQLTLVRGAFEEGWETVARVYPPVAFCLHHWFLLREHTCEWENAQRTATPKVI